MGNFCTSAQEDEEDALFNQFKLTIKNPKVFQRMQVILKESTCSENGDFLKEYYEVTDIDRADMVQLGLMSQSEKKKFDRKVVTSIYDGYIKPDAPKVLNLPATVYNDFEQKYQKQKYDISILEPVAKEVLMMIYSNNYPTYVKRFGDETRKKSISHSFKRNSVNGSIVLASVRSSRIEKPIAEVNEMDDIRNSVNASVVRDSKVIKTDKASNVSEIPEISGRSTVRESITHSRGPAIIIPKQSVSKPPEESNNNIKQSISKSTEESKKIDDPLTAK